MAEPFSRPDPSSPAGVAGATFGTARKGFDQQQVREFLRQVAGELSRAQERATALEQQLREATAAPPAEPVALDEETVTRLLGEEAARILTTARESGAQIKAKSEEGAARLLKDASDESARLRQETDVDIARRRLDATADVEAELAMAKQQGREMVEEARTYRERVLGELGRRREAARQQVDQLVRSRDRLVQAFERARLAAADVIAEVAPLEAPDDDIDLSPTTGPVPVVKVDTPDDSAVGIGALPGEAGEPAAATAGQGMYDHEHEPTDDAQAITSEVATTVVDGDAGDPEVEVAADEVDADAGADEPSTADDEGTDATIVPFPGASANPTAAPVAVDDLFARLRAESTDEPTDDESGDESSLDDGPAEVDPSADAEPGETPFSVREAAIVPLIVAAARKFKRTLADEQNEVLDTLRRDAVASLAELVSDEGTQSKRYVEAIAGELASAATAGAASIGDAGATDGDAATAVAGAGDALARQLIPPLRERLARCVEEGGDDTDATVKRVRAVYREWKTQRIDEQLDDLFRTAYARAAYDAIEPGRPVRWLLDPDGPASPDCEDNSLERTLLVGDMFPTGHAFPPAHPGCRCLLVPAAAD